MAKTHEERLESKVIRDLRKRLRIAETEVRRLRKLNHTLEQTAHANPFDAEEEEIVEKEVRNERQVFECPKCGASCKNLFILRKLEYFKCDCGAKGRVK